MMTGLQGKVRIGLRCLLVLIFLAAGMAKVAGAPMMVDEFALFASYGIGQWFRYLTAFVEIGGALLLIRAATAFYGAGLLTCVCIGALVAQLVVIHQDWVHCVVIGLIAAWTGWGYRARITKA